ncbi:hypothetical protein [Natribacillus halophilus]|uniref:Uncharacterized protein n=1 Tax=Natribacillus halophilus TaxID=549003 RepID=A0A1G8RV67_9BACI|nr:hypothetical protein [Natribacillus halophilus]SDJ20852.1 hypothetical protein SAMN04488123_12066 [Natribacillus halophilus]
MNLDERLCWQYEKDIQYVRELRHELEMTLMVQKEVIANSKRIKRMNRKGLAPGES